jgi:serine/threonine protein kinase
MGEVFLARERIGDGAGRRVAVKRIRTDLATNPRFRDLFHHEARVATRLNHPNIVPVREVGTSGEDLYLTMEYVEGRTLHDLMRQAALLGLAIPIEVTLGVALDVARGLHHAHELAGDDGVPFDIVHRDMSPQNVMIGVDGIARILDFGLARAAAALEQEHGIRLQGTPGYFSPELARLEPIDHRSDIYSLGVILWEMTTGLRLYPVDDALQALELVGNMPIPSPAELRPIPPGWEGVLRRALAADPDERYGTARALQLDVEDVARAAGHMVSNLPVVSLLAALYPEVALDLDADPPRARRPSVLVVDDEPLMLEVIARSLRRSVQVRTARSVAEALLALAAQPFDAIITDERMPDERGIDLLVHATRESPRTVRIMLTAYADTDLLLAAINRGQIDRLALKPFQPADLLALVEDAIAHHPRLRVPEAASPSENGVSDAPTEPVVAEPAGAGPPAIALPWESLRHLAEPVRADALSCALLVGVADQAIRAEEQATIEWVLSHRLPSAWLHIEDRALVLLLPGIAPASAAALATELRDTAFGALGARLAVAMAELPAGDDLAAAGRLVERAAVDAWREEGRRGS